MANILIVDDEAILLELLSSILEEEGHEIVTANNGRQALDLIQHASQPIELVISDVMMPVMDGYSLLEAVRQNAASARLPFVLISAAPIKRDSTYTADAYLTKPYDIATVEQIVSKLTPPS